MLQAKATKTKISMTLGRDRSTTRREIKRNFWADDAVPKTYAGYFEMAVIGATYLFKAHLAFDSRLRPVRGHEGVS